MNKCAIKSLSLFNNVIYYILTGLQAGFCLRNNLVLISSNLYITHNVKMKFPF